MPPQEVQRDQQPQLIRAEPDAREQALLRLLRRERATHQQTLAAYRQALATLRAAQEEVGL